MEQRREKKHEKLRWIKNLSNALTRLLSLAMERYVSKQWPTEKLPSIEDMPDRISFSRQIIRGIADLENKIHETDHEHAGIIFSNQLGKAQYIYLTEGTNTLVPIEVHNFTSFQRFLEFQGSYNYAQGELRSMLLAHKVFCLISPDEDIASLPERANHHVLKKGRQFLGDIHGHPSGNPPNAEFIRMLFHVHEEENMQGRIKCITVSGELYVFVRSAESPKLDIEQTDEMYPDSNIPMDSLTILEQKVNQEIEDKSDTYPQQREAVEQVLIKYCKVYKIGFYKGQVSKNDFKRIA